MRNKTMGLNTKANSTWYVVDNEQIKLSVTAKPNAKNSAYLGISQNRINIALHAKPYHGEANKELIRYLSILFEMPKSQIRIIKGENCRYKQVVMPINERVRNLIFNPDLFVSS